EGSLSRKGDLRSRMMLTVDDFHHGFRIYMKRGKRAYLTAFLLTFGFFCSRFAVAYFVLLGLGLPTTPTAFVTVGPPLIQIILVQALLNFVLYLSPIPSAGGLAEASSRDLMSQWVKAPFDVPYVLVWRLLAQFLCMFVGGVYVFRFLGADVLESKVKEVEAEKRAHEDHTRPPPAAATPDLPDSPPPSSAPPSAPTEDPA
ncbi:MAG: flippase-like domain-containing protein, partial [Polyangiaceae bacterium]